MVTEALSTDQLKNVALGGIIGVVVIGLIVALLVQAIIARIIVVAVVVVLAVVFYTQRTTIENRVKDCNSNVSFLGFHATLSQSAQTHCQQIGKQVTNR